MTSAAGIPITVRRPESSWTMGDLDSRRTASINRLDDEEMFLFDEDLRSKPHQAFASKKTASASGRVINNNNNDLVDFSFENEECGTPLSVSKTGKCFNQIHLLFYFNIRL